MAAIEMPIDRIATDDDWMREGACRGLTHLFFPPAAERPQARERREAGAKEVCSSCVVRVACMDFARENHEYGFWGGESEDERHAAGFRPPAGGVAEEHALHAPVDDDAAANGVRHQASGKHLGRAQALMPNA